LPWCLISMTNQVGSGQHLEPAGFSASENITI